MERNKESIRAVGNSFSCKHNANCFKLFSLIMLLLLTFSAQASEETSGIYSGYQLTHLPQSSSQLIKLVILIPLFTILFILGVYVIRHYFLALNRLFAKQHHFYAEIIEANWPRVTILVPAHNEETVIRDLLEGVLKVDYPPGLLQVIIVNDRSTDSTGEIVDGYVSQYPDLFTHFNRQEGKPGKSAALFDVMSLVKHEITLVFDADYIPGPFLIKELVCPFFDPEVGAVMGRVVPGNTNVNLLTRLIDIERTGGYQVNQQARENTSAVPQYGGTSGGIRTQALNDVGGWDEKILAEDTEITYRLLLKDWITIYQNKAECIELVPETWAVRIRQIKRWSKGHNQVMYKYFFKTMFNGQLKLITRLDGVLLLFIYLVSPMLVLGWLLFLFAYFLGIVPGASGVLGFLIIISFSGVGNFTIFFEIATAVHLDNLRGVKGNRIRLLPLMYMNFFVSTFAITAAFLEQITLDLFKKEVVWQRTHHPTRQKR